MGRSILIRSAKVALQTREMPGEPLRKSDMGELPFQEDVSILIRDGVIEEIISSGKALPPADMTIDASGRTILPAWCDSHTHLVFATSREHEFVDRIHGLSYEEIGKKGGGILNSARKLRDMTEDELYAAALMRLDGVQRMGTGSIEIKSGYGLTPDSELKMLRVIRRLKEDSDLIIKATFLGAHAVPEHFGGNRAGYVEQIINEMLPEIARHNLADYIDVFCERGYFSNDDTLRVAKAGAVLGLKAKLHVNQLSNSGGVQAGLEANALSLDHLEDIGDEEVALLAESRTVATLLPLCSFFINIPYAPARQLIDKGAAVALATDFNPGSAPSANIPLLMAMACIKMGMTPEETINAVTINGAFAMEAQDEAGVIASGRPARLVITKKIPSLAYIPYAFGSDHIEYVVLKDRVLGSRD